MDQFLIEFFNLFDYPSDARKTILDVYQRIKQNTDLSKQWKILLEEYSSDINCDYNEQFKVCCSMATSIGVSEFTTCLLLLICHSKHLRDMYDQKGIDKQIWYDSMLDLKAKLFECHEVYGIWGTFVASWYPFFFQMKRFALGRLQFEPMKFGKKYAQEDVVLDENSIVLNVHIPRTMTPLDPETCDAAFRTAANFFKQEFKITPCVFVCRSWLLFPEHETMLPVTSNIRAFFKTFDIIESGYYGSEGDNLWRLFDTMERNPDRLPANTSLRRAYIDRLRRGERLGWGYGVYCPKF